MWNDQRLIILQVAKLLEDRDRADAEKREQIDAEVLVKRNKRLAGGLAEMLGMPLGFILTPYMPLSDKSHLYIPSITCQHTNIIRMKSVPRLTSSAYNIARCSKCTAYINPFCDASNMRWLCSLCGYRNSFTRNMVYNGGEVSVFDDNRYDTAKQI